jgi:hypothetical protein
MNGRRLRTAGMLLLGGLIGVLLLGATRLALLPPAEEHDTHYHANWAVFIRGERLDLSGERYMEDVFRCKANPNLVEPADRVHMHNGEQDVVHVHHEGVTWGHFLANLGFSLGDSHFFTDEHRLENDARENLKFILNGEPVLSIRNRLIEDEDRLLISFGPEQISEVLGTQFSLVASNAGEYNLLPDPGGCGSAQPHDQHTSPLRRAFWF